MASADPGQGGAAPGDPDPGALTLTAGQPAGALTLTWCPSFPLDLLGTVSVHRRGTGDPTFRIDPAGAVWRTTLTPDGPATLRLGRVMAAEGEDRAGGVSQQRAARPGTGLAVRASAWGPGADWALRAVPALLGAADDATGFEPIHQVLADSCRRHAAFRLGRSGRVLEALIPAIMEQKVVSTEAWRAWRLLLYRFGTPPPGPGPDGMRVFPPPSVWARIPSWEWHRAGLEAVRAKTIIGACRVAARLEEITGMSSADADARLRALPGIGVWTSAETRQRACGDPDALSVGDYHLPGVVGYALTGERGVDDAGMLELLAPYAGHRHRAARLLEMTGLTPPRRGPRMPVRDYRSF